MASPYTNANMDPYSGVSSTPYQFPRKSPYAAGLPTCPNNQNYLPVLTGPQNMYYMVCYYSIDDFKDMSPCTTGGHWNNWLSLMYNKNNTGQMVMVAPFLPGGCSTVQGNSPLGNGYKTPVGIPIWFEDGGPGGDPIMLSYVDSVTNAWIGNAYRVCTFGHTGITSAYDGSPICGNAISNDPQSQANTDGYCYGCSPSQQTVLYLSWIDGYHDAGAVTMGWVRPTCASITQTLSEACISPPPYQTGIPSLRGNAVNFFFSLGDYSSATPSFNPIPSWHAPYLGMGETFIMSMQGSYLPTGSGEINPDNQIQSWGNSFPQPAFMNTYAPSGNHNQVAHWPVYCQFPLLGNSPSFKYGDFPAYFQVAPLGNGSFPTPSNYCISPPKGASYDQWCGGKSLTDFTTANPTCTPNHVSCIRNTYFSGWSCLGQSAGGGGGGGGGSCSGKCVSVPNVCDATGQCSNSLFYTPECNQGKWSCGKKTTSWVAVIIAILILLLIMIWVFMG